MESGTIPPPDEKCRSEIEQVRAYAEGVIQQLFAAARALDEVQPEGDTLEERCLSVVRALKDCRCRLVSTEEELRIARQQTR